MVHGTGPHENAVAKRRRQKCSTRRTEFGGQARADPSGSRPLGLRSPPALAIEMAPTRARPSREIVPVTSSSARATPVVRDRRVRPRRDFTSTARERSKLPGLVIKEGLATSGRQLTWSPSRLRAAPVVLASGRVGRPRNRQDRAHRHDSIRPCPRDRRRLAMLARTHPPRPADGAAAL